MFINELEGFFGELGEEERLWVADNLEKLEEDTKSRFFNELNQAHKNKNLKPDISELKKVLSECIGNGNFREKFVLNALELAAKNHNLEKNGKNVRNIICG